MKMDWTKTGWTLGLAVMAWLAAGCGPRRPPTQEQLDEESRRRSEAAAKEHVIGYDPTGFPVYGVDEDGKPIYTRDK